MDFLVKKYFLSYLQLVANYFLACLFKYNLLSLHYTQALRTPMYTFPYRWIMLNVRAVQNRGSLAFFCSASRMDHVRQIQINRLGPGYKLAFDTFHQHISASQTIKQFATMLDVPTQQSKKHSQ